MTHTQIVQEMTVTMTQQHQQQQEQHHIESLHNIFHDYHELTTTFGASYNMIVITKIIYV